MPHAIVSYDGTLNDDDALALGRLFALAGAHLTLAYVRHAPESDPQREANVAHEAEQLLVGGASRLGDAEIGRRVVFDPSTANGLAELAAELGAQIIAFGSSEHIPEGHVELPHTAEQLLDGEVGCSLALAPAGIGESEAAPTVATVSVYDEDDDGPARDTAASLAHALGATLVEGDADLLVVTSQREIPLGRLGLSATARDRVEQASSPVLVLVRGAAFTFG